ncbi:MAG: hypothetical protein ACREFX_00155, partial [Opitutaceae bacterium]
MGLDALNRLQRIRAEGAAVRAATVLPSAAHAPRPQINRLLLAGLIFSLGVASAALYCSHGRAPAVQIVAESR